MKFAVSNIALSTFDHTDDFGHLAAMGLSGLEVAPSRVWRDTWRGLTTVEVNDYRRRAEQAGLRIVGLHSLLYDQPDLALFGDTETLRRTLDFMTHLSTVCRDLGGRTHIHKDRCHPACHLGGHPCSTDVGLVVRARRVARAVHDPRDLVWIELVRIPYGAPRRIALLGIEFHSEQLDRDPLGRALESISDHRFLYSRSIHGSRPGG